MTKLLEVKNLTTCFYRDGKAVPVVDNVSFSINKNSVLGMVGESGCGKTMTALSITRLLPQRNCAIASGTVKLCGEDITALPEEALREKRGKDIAYIFQEPSTALNPVLTIGEQIKEVIQAHRPDVVKEALADFIIAQLRAVGIHTPEKKITAYPHQLSGGEKQRVMIAMAMACRPKLLIADEPTTALDVTIQAQIIDLLEKLKAAFGVSVLFISHDLAVIAELADYVAVMYAGQIVEYSGVSEITARPRHPYTQGLFACLPEKQTGKEKTLSTIPGEVPRAGDLPPGCRFHPRCPQVFERCCREAPPLVKTGENQEVRCWLYSGLVK